MNVLKITRGNTVKQTLYFSNAGGNFRMVLVDDERDAETGQPVVYVPTRINVLIEEPERVFIDESGAITFPENMQKLSIETLWRRLVFTNTGKKSASESTSESMIANEVDVPDFVSLLGAPIIISMINGRIRAINGYNTKPVFNQLGQVVEYPVEELAEGPTHNYMTHRADGTPVHPEPELEPVSDPNPEIETPEEDVNPEPDENLIGE